MRPDRSWRPSFDWTSATAERSGDRLLCSVRLRRGERIQRRNRNPRENVEARHRLTKSLDPKQWAGWKPRRDVRVCECAAGEGTEAADRNEQAGSRK